MLYTLEKTLAIVPITRCNRCGKIITGEAEFEVEKPVCRECVKKSVKYVESLGRKS